MQKNIKLYNFKKLYNRVSKKYSQELSSISNYALENPLEAVAEDITKLICNALNDDLALTKNPFLNSAYDDFIHYHIAQHCNPSKRNKLIRAFWNGKFK